MGHHVTLVRSQPGLIAWDVVAAAGRRLGWEVDATIRELSWRDRGRVVGRAIQDDSGKPRTTSSDAAGAGAGTALKKRLRDGFRSVVLPACAAVFAIRMRTDIR